MPGKRAPGDVRREQILQAAFEVASRDGIGGLAIRAVAARAGLSHALVVHCFRRKERLVHALHTNRYPASVRGIAGRLA